ncbi:hypothetical protein Agub_g5633, partial [Astrephomene gubernaculifera]
DDDEEEEDGDQRQQQQGRHRPRGRADTGGSFAAADGIGGGDGGGGGVYGALGPLQLGPWRTAYLLPAQVEPLPPQVLLPPPPPPDDARRATHQQQRPQHPPTHSNQPPQQPQQQQQQPLQQQGHPDALGVVHTSRGFATGAVNGPLLLYGTSHTANGRRTRGGGVDNPWVGRQGGGGYGDMATDDEEEGEEDVAGGQRESHGDGMGDEGGGDGGGGGGEGSATQEAGMTKVLAHMARRWDADTAHALEQRAALGRMLALTQQSEEQIASAGQQALVTRGSAASRPPPSAGLLDPTLDLEGELIRQQQEQLALIRQQQQQQEEGVTAHGPVGRPGPPVANAAVERLLDELLGAPPAAARDASAVRQVSSGTTAAGSSPRQPPASPQTDESSFLHLSLDSLTQVRQGGEWVLQVVLRVSDGGDLDQGQRRPLPVLAVPPYSHPQPPPPTPPLHLDDAALLLYCTSGGGGGGGCLPLPCVRGRWSVVHDRRWQQRDGGQQGQEGQQQQGGAKQWQQDCAQQERQEQQGLQRGQRRSQLLVVVEAAVPLADLVALAGGLMG